MEWQARITLTVKNGFPRGRVAGPGAAVLGSERERQSQNFDIVDGGHIGRS